MSKGNTDTNRVKNINSYTTLMKLLYNYITPDDGYFKLFKTDCNVGYHDVYDDISSYVYDCDGFSINSRNTGLFTNDREKVGKSLCSEWKYTPPRYIYQSFTPLLHRLLDIVQPLYDKHRLRDAIVNVYGEGDFISYHKDYHASKKEPCSIVFSFEYVDSEEHTMEFYRTTGPDWCTKKDKSETREDFTIRLPHQSVGLMVGMQRKYVHAIRPGNKRISVVFR